MQHIEKIKLSDYPINGFYGDFGGKFVPEILLPALEELENAYDQLSKNEKFLYDLAKYNHDFGGRPTPLFFAENLTKHIGGAKIYLKREDLCHGGAHKFNNVMGQGLLAKAIGKKRIIAETGAGQHGVATAIVGAVLGLETHIYMGKVDVERQFPNVQRMELLGAEVIPVTSGSQTLKDAVNEALREWVHSVETTHYLIGSVVGPHPFPKIVRDFQSVIGNEIKNQMHDKNGSNLPDAIVACVGGGSNSAGAFYPFIDDSSVKLIGVEAGGKGMAAGDNCGTLSTGTVGIFHGSKSYLLQDNEGQVSETYSISAGLDYPGVGPEHSFWKQQGRVLYEMQTDEKAIQAFYLLARMEGIIPALESAHAVSKGLELAKTLSFDESIVIVISGRGDKDIPYLMNNKNFHHIQ